MKAQWFFYIVRCKDNSLYSGITNNLDERVKKHNAGKGARYTASRLPVNLAYVERCPDATSARKREGEVKGWDKKRKEQLIKSVPESPETKQQRPYRRQRYPMPDYMQKALEEHGLTERYQSRPPYQRNDYIGWITRAKTETTRSKRLGQMLNELEEGRHYMGMDYQPKKSG